MFFSGIRMVKLRNKKVTWLVIAILVSSVFSVTHLVFAGAQSSGKTEGLWHLDEVVPAEYRGITRDATVMNPGTLVHAPADPILVEGKFDKALRFDGHNGVYVPIRFLGGFRPS